VEAYRIDRFASVDGIVLRSNEDPRPGLREILMRVRASSCAIEDAGATSSNHLGGIGLHLMAVRLAPHDQPDFAAVAAPSIMGQPSSTLTDKMLAPSTNFGWVRASCPDERCDNGYRPGRGGVFAGPR
jgi:hypothetical protein